MFSKLSKDGNKKTQTPKSIKSLTLGHIAQGLPRESDNSPIGKYFDRNEQQV